MSALPARDLIERGRGVQVRDKEGRRLSLPLCRELAELRGMEMALPMNTGAEAAETAIKTARRW